MPLLVVFSASVSGGGRGSAGDVFTKNNWDGSGSQHMLLARVRSTYSVFILLSNLSESYDHQEFGASYLVLIGMNSQNRCELRLH